MIGIKIGEIGCKLGMNTVNNGYLGFDNVRIPRDRMLMKNSKVLKVICRLHFLDYLIIKSVVEIFFSILRRMVLTRSRKTKN